MAARKLPRLTPTLQQRIVASIRAGGYPHVAAQAAGISPARFDDWLKRGQADGAWEPYRSFAEEVRGASAQARLRAETALFTDEPKRWLAHGPGRDSAASPGWSTPVKPATTNAETQSALLDPAFLEFVNELLEALKLFPEAHHHVIQMPRMRDLAKAA